MLKKLETAIVRYCGAIWKSPMSGRLMVLAGNNGTGKTHCAKAVHRWIGKVGSSNEFVSSPGHVSHLESIYWLWSALLDNFKNGGWDVVDDMLKVPVLIIDDLGAGHDPSLVGTDKLCQILSRRERKWTIITTNLTPAAWGTSLDKRIASRLFRNAELVDLSEVPDFSQI